MACYDMFVEEFEHSTMFVKEFAKSYFNFLFCRSCPSLWRHLDKPQT